MRNKIISDFADLGQQEALSLRDSLVNHLRNARNGSQPLVTQLCLALADLAVQLSAWTDPFTDMTNAFLSDPDSVSCLLEFLAVLPEEVLNERIMVPNNAFQKRSAELLTMRASDMIRLLVQCLQQPELKADAHTRVLVCFTSWLRNGEITLQMIENTPLIELAFAALKSVEDGSVFDTAVDAVCGIIYETHLDRDDEPEAVQIKNKTIEQRLVPELNAVSDQMRADSLVAEGDEDRIRGYCRIFTEAGEAWVQRIVTNINVFGGLVGALVDCMRLDNLDVIGMMFCFWNSLADRTMEYTNSCDQARRSLATAFETIIDIIIRHLKYPSTYDESDIRGGMSAKERDEFREFRHNIGDVLKDCVVVVGQAKALAHPYNNMANGISNGAVQVPWQEIEASLFALRAMGAEISPEENEMLPKIMDMFARFPSHPKLRYAATLVIGRYTEWTYEHPQYVQFQLNYIAEGFKVKEVTAASAQSLKYLCQDCSKYLAEHWADLMKFFNELVGAGSTLRETDIVEFSEALAHVVSAVPAPATASAVESFCMPIGQEMDNLLQQQQPPSDLGEQGRQQMALLFDRAGVFLRYVMVEDNESAEALVDRFITEIWPLVNTAIQRFAADPLISESASKFVRILVEYYPNVLRPMVTQIIDTVVAAFQATGLGVYLWLARRMFGASQSLASDEGAAMQLATNMVERLSEAALSLFQQTSSFSDIPETTEDYFRLIERAVETAPGYIINIPSFPYIAQAAVAALDINHFHAQMAVLHVWAQILNPAKRHLRLVRENRSTSQMMPTIGGDHHTSANGTTGTVQRQRRRSLRLNTYPVTQVVDLCTRCGLDLAAKLLCGVLRSFDREAVSEGAEIFASLAAIVSDGPEIVKGQFDSQPLLVICEWSQSTLSQIPGSSFPMAEKQAFLNQLSEHIQARQWPKIKTLVSDTAAVFWRRNASKK